MSVPCYTSTYPHLNYSLEVVSSNLGHYVPLLGIGDTCNEKTIMLTNRTCLNEAFLSKWGISPDEEFDLREFIAQTSIPDRTTSDDDWTNYVQAVSTMVSWFLFLAVGIASIDLSIILTGCCCCCCRCIRQAETPQNRGICQKFTLVAVYIVVASWLLTRAQFLGNRGITNGMEWVTTYPPQTAAALGQEMAAPFQQELVPGWTTHLQSFMVRLNTTVAQVHARDCLGSRRLLQVGGDPEEQAAPSFEGQEMWEAAAANASACQRWSFFSAGRGRGSLAHFMQTTSTTAVAEYMIREGVISTLIFLIAELGVALENLGDTDDVTWSAGNWEATAQAMFGGAKNELDALEDLGGSAAVYGDFWYIARLWGEWSGFNVTHPEAFDDIPEERRLIGGERLSRSTIVPYTDGKTCLSDTCVHNGVASFNKDDFRHFGLSSAYSRQGLSWILLSPILLILLLALASLATGFDTPALWLSSCTLLWLPFAFLMVLPAVPVAIFVEDFCDSVQPLAIKNARVFVPVYCSEFSEPAEGFDQCTTYLPRLHFELTNVPFLALVERVFSDAEGTNGDPFATLWTEVEAASAPVFRGNLTDLLQGQLEATLGHELLGALPPEATTAAVEGMTSSVSAVFVGLSAILTGERLSSVRALTMGGLCCQFTHSIALFIESVTGLALAGLLLAVPGGAIIFRGYFKKDLVEVPEDLFEMAETPSAS